MSSINVIPFYNDEQVEVEVEVDVKVLQPAFGIYIPRVPKSVTQELISYYFWNNSFGSVKRVDFSPIGKPPGFGEHKESEFYCAFVHFHYYCNNQHTQDVLARLDIEGGSYRYYYDANISSYWILVKNHRPIPDSEMNTHQIVENARVVERRVFEQNEQVQFLENKLYELEAQVYNLQDISYNLKANVKEMEQFISRQADTIARLEDVIYSCIGKTI